MSKDAANHQGEPSPAREAFIRNRCWVGYLSPFTVVVPRNEEPFAADLEEINDNTYDYGKLSGIVHSMPLGHDGELRMLICRDGGIAIPIVPSYATKEDVVDFFNKLFCSLLIGGHLCEAVDTRDIVGGGLLETHSIWPVDVGQSASSSLHFKLRTKKASNIESIILLKPRHIHLEDFVSRVQLGQKVLTKVTNLTPTFLIRGITELSWRNWSAALSNLWITAEQLTDFIWHNLFIGSSAFSIQSLPSRTKSMHEDNRTWSIAVKQELLFSAGFITESEYAMLYPARQARNKLVHEGKRVEESVVMDLVAVVSALMSKASDQSNLLVFKKTISASWIHKRSKAVVVEDSFENWKNVTADGLK